MLLLVFLQVLYSSLMMVKVGTETQSSAITNTSLCYTENSKASMLKIE